MSFEDDCIYRDTGCAVLLNQFPLTPGRIEEVRGKEETVLLINDDALRIYVNVKGRLNLRTPGVFLVLLWAVSPHLKGHWFTFLCYQSLLIESLKCASPQSIKEINGENF